MQMQRGTACGCYNLSRQLTSARGCSFRKQQRQADKLGTAGITVAGAYSALTQLKTYAPNANSHCARIVSRLQWDLTEVDLAPGVSSGA